MLLRLTGFKGMAPSIDASVLPEQMAQVAVNCHLGNGSIRPMHDTSIEATATKGASTQSIYPYDGKWFNWTTDVNCVRSPIAQDAFDRRYWSGDGSPKMTAQGIATSSGDYPSGWYDLGIPSPAVAPTVTAYGAITDSDPTLVESRMYVYTYVSEFGEEGPPSDVSVMVDVAPGQWVAVTGMSGVPSGDHSIVAKNIYRLNTGSTATDYQYVGSVGVSMTTYNDTISSSDLGEIMPSADWQSPPDELQGIISLPIGCLAGFYNNILCLSAPYFPHAWPAANQYPLEDTVMAIGSYGASVLIATTGAPYVATGNAPGSMSLERLEMGYACVSKRGFVDMGYACIYPAIDGLMMVGMKGVQLVSSQLLSQRDWLSYAPHTIHAYLYDGKYIAFWTNAVSAGFVYDPDTGDLVLHDIPASAGYHDPATGTLYIAYNGTISTWEGSVGKKTASWTSKKFTFPFPVSLAAGHVMADNYPVIFKLYLDDVLAYTYSVPSNMPFRLPGGKRSRACYVELSGTSIINEVHVATSLSELSAA